MRRFGVRSFDLVAEEVGVLEVEAEAEGKVGGEGGGGAPVDGEMDGILVLDEGGFFVVAGEGVAGGIEDFDHEPAVGEVGVEEEMGSGGDEVVGFDETRLRVGMEGSEAVDSPGGAGDGLLAVGGEAAVGSGDGGVIDPHFVADDDGGVAQAENAAGVIGVRAERNDRAAVG